MIQTIITVDPVYVQEFVRSWVKALRSGDYIQGQMRLLQSSPYEGPRYCCLGVACEIANVGKLPLEDGSVSFQFGPNESASNTALPPLLREAIGITPEFERKLQKANDDEQKSFSEIADMIEEYYRDLGFTIY